MKGKTTVKNWLARLAPKTAKDYSYTFDRWMSWMDDNGGKFAGMTPDELVEYQKDSDRRSQYEILDHVQHYVVLATRTRIKTKARTYAIMRSFFLHNRAELPKDLHFKIRSDTPPVLGTLTVEEIRNATLVAKPRYRAALLSLFQGGMDQAEFEYWNQNGWEKLREDLLGNPNVIRIDIPGRKRFRNIKPFYTMIGGDAIEAIRTYLPKRPEGGTAIFYTNRLTPITGGTLDAYWTRNLIRLGIIKQVPQGERHSGTRYGKNLHEMRDVFRSQWEKSPAKGSVAEFMMGHLKQIDPNEYNKAFRDEDWVRREYLKALPHLQLLTSDRAFGKTDIDEVETLRRRNEELARDNKENKSEIAKLVAQVAGLAEAIKNLS